MQIVINQVLTKLNELEFITVFTKVQLPILSHVPPARNLPSWCFRAYRIYPKEFLIKTLCENLYDRDRLEIQVLFIVLHITACCFLYHRN